MKKNLNLRSLAAKAVEQVVEQGQSLSNVLPPLQQKVGEKDKALLQERALVSCVPSASWTGWLTN